MSNATNPRDSRPAAVPVGSPPARRKWLLPLLIGLIALIAVLFLLSRCGDDDSAAPTSTATSAPAASTATSAQAVTPTSASAGQNGSELGGEPGTVIADGANLLGAPAETLRTHDGQQATGRAARVQSVPADEGFWVGTSEQERLWIQLTGTGGESDYKVKQGDSIDFTATVTPVPQGFATKVGVSPAEGAAQLTDQGYYLSVPSSTVKLSR